MPTHEFGGATKRAALHGFAASALLLLVVTIGLLAPCSARAAEHVIHISVDGLNAQILQAVIDAGDAPAFKRLQDEGAWTLNARTDFTHTNTLPNHTSMITCRPVLQPDGTTQPVCHFWTFNDVPKRNTTLHSNNPDLDYIASVFDVVHDAGLSTALYSGKDKFVIYKQSYNEHGGSPAPHGRNKFDAFFIQDDGPPRNSATINERFLTDMAAHHFQYVFLHYRDTDSAGHKFGWGGSAYRQAVKTVDSYLADVMKLVDTDKKLAGNTAIILSSDHGGMWFTHTDPIFRPNYTIPMFVWGADVGRGDLYAINSDIRSEPGEARPDYNATGQPIRNGETGNLALSLLRLGPVPGSFINAKQDLRVALPGDYSLNGVVDAADFIVWKETEGSNTDLCGADGNRDGRVDQADYDHCKARFGQSATPKAATAGRGIRPDST